MMNKFLFVAGYFLLVCAITNAQNKNCLTKYGAKVALLCKVDSIELNELYKINPSRDSLFSAKIKNTGKMPLKMLQTYTLTYENDRSPYDLDMYYKMWYKDSSNTYVEFNKYTADIDFIIDLESNKTPYKFIYPNRSISLTNNINPFFMLDVFPTPQKYRIQLFYRMKTTCGDFIAKSNFIYINTYIKSH